MQCAQGKLVRHVQKASSARQRENLNVDLNHLPTLSSIPDLLPLAANELNLKIQCRHITSISIERLPSCGMGSADVDAKAKRYDRQIRIWGPHGQDALEEAHICVINAGALPSPHAHMCAIPSSRVLPLHGRPLTVLPHAGFSCRMLSFINAVAPPPPDVHVSAVQVLQAAVCLCHMVNV